jgi:VIT1/CCC1 family predicted Fe2+/Mn2+ transporter
MTPERMAELVARWVRFYTRKLPTPIAQRRVDEIGADLHDHIAHERARRTSDWRIALSILSRMLRGVAADASWRGQHANPAYRSTIRIVLVAAFILSLPLLAMLITDEVVWGLGDFALAGVLLVGTGLVHARATRTPRNIAYRAAVGVAIATAFILLFLMGAVGIIGEDGDPADLMYFGVLAVGIVGAVIARLQPEGMARAMLATALAQALVAVIALIAGKHQAPISSVWEILGLNGFFVALFVGSAWLFRHAARKQPL